MPYLKALAAGVLIGVLYAMIRVPSPAPPPVALLGLLGLLAGQALLEAL